MPDQPEPTPVDPPADTPPPAPPPRHVSDPIPPAVEVEAEEVVTETDFIPDLSDMGTDANPDAGLEDSDLPAGTEGSAAGERVHIEPSDIAVGHLGTEDLSQDRRSQGAKDADQAHRDAKEGYQEWIKASESQTDEPDSGFIERPPISDEAKRFAGFKGKVVAGVVGLGVIAFILFSNLGGDTPVVAPADPPVEAADDPEPEPEPATQGQSSDEPATADEPVANQEPVSNSVQVTDPAGDNGRGGTGADILGLEYVQDGEDFTVLLTMGFSPLEASVLWYSYYTEVTLITLLENSHVLIWENHAGESRSGELDSDGNANGVGVTLTDEVAEFQKTLAPGDRVVEVRVVAFSLVEQEDQVTEDRMSVDVGAP